MKTKLAIILIATIANAETWTIGDRSYENVEVISVTPATVEFSHSAGTKTVGLQALPPDLQDRFQYDPNRAADYLKSELKARIDAAEKMKADTQAVEKPSAPQAGTPKVASAETKAEPKKDTRQKRTYTGKVVSKNPNGFTMIVSDTQGVSGSSGGLGYSLINQGNSKPKDARKTSKEAQKERKAADSQNTYTVTGCPDLNRVFIGSSVSFVGYVPSGKSTLIEWAQ